MAKRSCFSDGTQYSVPWVSDQCADLRVSFKRRVVLMMTRAALLRKWRKRLFIVVPMLGGYGQMRHRA